jgi:hypothetical protein
MFKGSVFDLMTDKDREKIESIKKGPETEKPPPSPPPPEPEERQPPSVLKDTAFQEFMRPGTTSTGFQPFAKDPSKQTRYEKYLAARKLGGIIPCCMVLVTATFFPIRK